MMRCPSHCLPEQNVVRVLASWPPTSTASSERQRGNDAVSQYPSSPGIPHHQQIERKPDADERIAVFMVYIRIERVSAKARLSWSGSSAGAAPSKGSKTARL
jgi:hypothetical protein